MQVRRLSELKRTQAQMLEALRAERAVAVEDSADAIESVQSTATMIGRVESVVSSDAALGAHLVIAKQKASGVPVAFDDDAVSNQVYYPAAGKVVGDYSLDDYVVCCLVDGMRIALKLA